MHPGLFANACLMMAEFKDNGIAKSSDPIVRHDGQITSFAGLRACAIYEALIEFRSEIGNESGSRPDYGYDDEKVLDNPYFKRFKNYVLKKFEYYCIDPKDPSRNMQKSS